MEQAALSLVSPTPAPKVDVTFYVPCHNEEEKIKNTLEKLVRVACAAGVTYEILVFNDGSTDQTQQLAEAFSAAHPDVIMRIIRNSRPRGLGYNYIEGAFQGLGNYYMMICGDDSETEESIATILGLRGSADIIVPYFDDFDTRNVFRRHLSKTFTKIVNLLNGFDVHYYNGVILHKRYNIMRWHPSSSGFAYQAELLSTLLFHNQTYVQVKIANKDRENGISRAFRLQNICSVTHSLLQIFFLRVRNVIWKF